MKKTLLAVTMLCTLFSSQAQPSNYPSEFFLLVKDNGNYTISFDDQLAGSSLHRFRFFDIQPGKSLLTITYNNKQIFKDYVTVTPNSRLVTAYNSRQGLIVTEVLKIYQDGRYNLDNWNNPMVQAGQNNFPGNRGESRRPGRMEEVMSRQDFMDLYQTIQKESFDDDKIKVFSIALRNNTVTVDQLSSILKMISFEEKRLDCALYAYDHIADTRNFYRVRALFTFISSKEKFDQAMVNK